MEKASGLASGKAGGVKYEMIVEVRGLDLYLFTCMTRCVHASL